MIMLTVASAISLLGLQASVNAPRSSLAQCIKEADAKAKSESVKVDAFGDYVRNACTTQASKLKSALVAFDTKNGIARSQASADAQMDIDDAFERAANQYKRLNSETAQVQQ